MSSLLKGGTVLLVSVCFAAPDFGVDCGDGGSPGNYCGPGGRFQGVVGTAQIIGPPTISILTNTFDLSIINTGPTNGVDQPGQFIASQAPGNIPFMNYVLCLSPALNFQRLLPIQVPTNGALTTTISISNGAQAGGGGTTAIKLVPGTTHYFQRWNREPGVGTGSNLTDAVGVCIIP